MMKYLLIITAMIASLYAADFTHMSTEDMMQMRGNVPVDQRDDFRKEMQKRMQSMTPQERQQYSMGMQGKGMKCGGQGKMQKQGMKGSRCMMGGQGMMNNTCMHCCCCCCCRCMMGGQGKMQKQKMGKCNGMQNSNMKNQSGMMQDNQGMMGGQGMMNN